MPCNKHRRGKRTIIITRITLDALNLDQLLSWVTPLSYRWVNLWLPVFSEPLAESCDFADGDASDDSSIGGSVFVGNTVLVLGLLLVVLFVHVTIISAVEAYWLAQVWLIHRCLVGYVLLGTRVTYLGKTCQRLHITYSTAFQCHTRLQNT